MAFANQSSTKIKKGDGWRLIACALTGIAINQLLFIKGLSITYSIHASLLMLTTPILITIFAAAFLNEVISGERLAGIVLGLGGAFILITSKDVHGDAVDIFLGDTLILLNAISYTVYFILVKPLMSKYRSLTVMRLVFTTGFFMMLPFCWNEFQQIPWNHYAITDGLVLGFIVIAGTLLAYVFNLYGIKILGATVAGSYIYSQPIFAALIAMFVLGEKFTIYSIIAGLMIFYGVYLANKKQRRA